MPMIDVVAETTLQALAHMPALDLALAFALLVGGGAALVSSAQRRRD